MVRRVAVAAAVDAVVVVCHEAVHLPVVTATVGYAASYDFTKGSTHMPATNELFIHHVVEAELKRPGPTMPATA